MIWLMAIILLSVADRSNIREMACYKAVKDLSRGSDFDIHAYLTPEKKAIGMKAINYILNEMFDTCLEKIPQEQVTKFSMDYSHKFINNFLGYTMEKYEGMDFPEGIDFFKRTKDLSQTKKDL
ncbi:hypothetical protein SteCoe_11988 [Stentor coeruleus]|uniref:PDEase domain-containing protein n=1 Tax=Stentor coeruleus TaxID=5963 RepID=A0A1R2CBV2_9CILI|nr:hypothetical protein SteCoe_11988 [Stentor coeruleus]